MKKTIHTFNIDTVETLVMEQRLKEKSKQKKLIKTGFVRASVIECCF
jgi:hypothetical protein